MRIASTAVLLGGFLLSAQAHESPHGWQYDPECCSNRDCAPYPAKNVKQVPGGYVIETGEFIENAKVKRSQDEEYHLCRHPTGSTIFCLYVPPQGS